MSHELRTPLNSILGFGQVLEMDELTDVQRSSVDQILKGANPGDLPIRYPSRYYLTLNNTAAKNLGLAFPAALFSKADRVLP